MRWLKRYSHDSTFSAIANARFTDSQNWVVQVTVYGAGAIGSLVGARLHQAGIDVTLVGRKAHVDAIATSGLLLKSAGGSQRVRLSTTTSLTRPADIVLLTVKSQDVTSACREIAQLNGDATVVTMQNGVRSDHEAAAVLGRERIIGCVLNVSASYLEAGVVEQNTNALLQLGVPFRESARRMAPVVEILGKALRTELVPDIARARWTKLMANLNNAIMTIVGLPIGAALRHQGLARLAIATIREGVRIARLGGFTLDDSARARTFRLMARLPKPIADLVFAGRLARDFPPDSQFGPSTLQSLRRGSSSELDYLNGEIVTLGERLGRTTPYNRGLLDLGRQAFETRRFLNPQDLISRFSQ